jgi:hypothetical protein
VKIELFLDEGEEYPQVFSVWRMDQKTERADLTTRRNYVDDRNGWDQWRKTDDENIRLKAENEKLRKLARDMVDYGEGAGIGMAEWFADRMRELGVETGDA